MEQKRGEGKVFKKGGKPGQGVCALKRGLEPPYELCLVVKALDFQIRVPGSQSWDAQKVI